MLERHAPPLSEINNRNSYGEYLIEEEDCVNDQNVVVKCTEIQNAISEERWTIPAKRIEPAKQRNWALSRIGNMWRSHKAYLKEKYCMEGVRKEELIELKPPKVNANQFHILVEYWFSKPDRELSRDNKERSKKQEEIRSCGSRSYAQMADLLEKRKGRQIERAELYEVVYSHKDGTAVTTKVEANIREVAGPTPSNTHTRNLEDYRPSLTSIATNQRVKELTAKVVELRERCRCVESLKAEVMMMRKMFSQLNPMLTIS
ncbi:hypothetical protein SO802_031722 [Lithocarpus litseifolius]|uniref:Uncharacterized protein n=1 Tax=Lithocarpus litseifolius TaxID=425828 RepID=A0AAW2BN39_9ROSI